MPLQTTGSSGLSAEMKTFYDRLLLRRTVATLLHAKFGQKRPIPAGGGKTIEFRRVSALATATTPLVEGQLYTNLKDLTVTAITATVSQYGDAIGFSDLVSTTTIDPILTETTELLGEQSAETIDEVIRDIIVAGTNVAYAGGQTARANLTQSHVLTPAEVRKAVLILKLARARRIGGDFHAIIHPRQTHDLISSQEWRDANQPNNAQKIFDGSLGRLYGVTFWESDKAKVYTDGGSASADVYAALFVGADAFGVVDLAKHNLRTIHKALGSAGTADPLDQQQTMGWKAAFTAKILDDSFILRYETGASTGS